MSGNDERRVVVEIFSHPEAERLREEIRNLDQIHKSDISRLEGRLEALHRTLFEVIEAIGKNHRK